MAIVINGSGTVTGLAVGGLPDGIVDSGTLATNSVDSAELIDGAVDDSHIAALASSKLTGALPAISGASLTGITTGKVLQVITAIDTGSWSSSSTSFADTNLSVTITPSSTSNKILVLGAVSYSNSLASSNNGLRLVRGSTDLTGHQIYSLTIDGAGSYQRAVWSWHHLDSPSTTSATTYKVQAGHNTNGSSISLHAAKDSITVMEISV